jgi:thioesterase domain-containing protein/acyl carrier protein
MLAPESLLSRNELTFLPPYEAPETAAEGTIAKLWADHFKLDRVGRNDDYFELGGDSFGAVALALALQEAFGKPFESSQFIEYSTVARQAERLSGGAAGEAQAALPSCLRGVQLSGSKPAFFWVHGGLGVLFVDHQFLEILGPDQPMYLFHLPGLDGREPTLRTVEEIAARYVSAIRAVQPSGPYRIVANCSCCWIALEMVLQFEASGEQVERLVLIDPTGLEGGAWLPAVDAIRGLVKTFSGWAGTARGRLGALSDQDERSDWRREVSEFAAGYGGAMSGGASRAATKQRKRARRIQRIEDGALDPGGGLDLGASDATTIARALDELTAAIDAYRPPRRWNGRAVLISSEARRRNLETWRQWVEAVEAHHLPGGHREVFKQHLADTAGLVRAALEGPAPG